LAINTLPLLPLSANPVIVADLVDDTLAVVTTKVLLLMPAVILMMLTFGLATLGLLIAGVTLSVSRRLAAIVPRTYHRPRASDRG
jgi:hypothetical protein